VPKRPVLALRADGLLIIDTASALLVVTSTHTKQGKHIAAELAAIEGSQGALHRKVFRPWAWYDGIDCGRLFQVNRINVEPDACLSMLRHRPPAEHRRQGQCSLKGA
jgi:mannose-1-phosphate guanylyltransferase/mannose-6-phosphate isomerase